MKKNALFLGSLFTSALLFTACSTDKELDDSTSNDKNAWQYATGLSIDPNQNWFTAVSVRLNIQANIGSTVTAFTIHEEVPTILGQKQMKGNGVMNIDVPQGIGESFGLECFDGETTQYKRIYLSGKKSQTEDVTFTSSRVMSRSANVNTASTRASSHNAALDGQSLNGLFGYSSFGGWAWESLAEALPEAQNIGNNDNITHDYEFTSFGPMYISFLYGYTGNYGKRPLGYYYHSKDSYSDITFVDLSETLYYDYIDSYAKVQYQLDKNESTWYDANFDYQDGDGLTTNKVTTRYKARQSDNAYNTLLVYREYGENISAMRGLTFKVDVPEGMEFGFYLKLPELSLSDEQKGYLINAGIPAEKLPECEMNFSHMAFNTKSGKGQYRSGMRSYGAFTFMGMDDSDNQGDMDCNDVAFGLLDKYGQPYSGTTPKVQTWTIAFEDYGTDIDFDFNDVVIQVTPNTYTHTAEVKLLAIGGAIETELYYGDKYLCEVHKAFGVDYTTMVNTSGDKATVAPVLISTDLDWPEDYSMDKKRNLFKIKAHRRDGTIVEVSTDAYLQNNLVPQAICVAGDWSWPKGGVKIFTAYPMIGQWGKNVNDANYWNWYTSHVADYIVTPYSE